MSLPPSVSATTRSVTGSPRSEDWFNPQAGQETVVLEDDQTRATFDVATGALLGLRCQSTGWEIQGRAELGQAFRAYVSFPDRLYGPISSLQCRPSGIELSNDHRAVTFSWDELQLESGERFPIRFTGQVNLRQGELHFTGHLDNQSTAAVTTVSWPVLGDVNPPPGEVTLERENFDYGTFRRTPLLPQMANERGYYGTNYPMQIEGKGARNPGVPGAYHFLPRFVLLSARGQGLYAGAHDDTARELVCFFSELRPGYLDSYHGRAPGTPRVSELPVHLTFEAIHYPFAAPGERAALAEVVLAPYKGNWHAGVDVYRRWRTTWHRPAPSPAWVHTVHAWQQLQIGSTEDDRRTRFIDLPSRARALARHGVTALQLVGWNDGGQDRGNPSHDPDPRLGTWEELKAAIGEIEAMGIHVILFNKFVWADVTRLDYEQFVSSAAVDPYGMPYYHPGYEYQTPVQWMSINNRRFMVACLHDPGWLERCAREFEKSVALGASGILYDEAFHHYAATHCFSGQHGHRVPATLYSGDLSFGERLVEAVRAHGAEDRFLLSAEAPFDLQRQHYALSYFRIFEGHIPAERYADPFYPIMIAVTGFEDREMINRALLYRYILSYEPYHFKGDLEDFPLTLAYGKLVDALRNRYADYLWHAEFRDILGAEVALVSGPPVSYSVFTKGDSGQTAVVLVNDDPMLEARVTVKLAAASGNLAWISPEKPDLHPCDAEVQVPPRGVVAVLSGGKKNVSG